MTQIILNHIVYNASDDVLFAYLHVEQKLCAFVRIDFSEPLDTTASLTVIETALFDKIPAVSAAVIIARVILALEAQTTSETDIPLVPDDFKPVELTF